MAEWYAAVDGIVSGMDDAVYRAVRDGAMAEKRAIRANISGPPRWDAQGNHHPRGGGPGVVTGRLLRGVSFSPIQKLGHGHYRTTVRAKRTYSTKTEQRYPYFTPGVRSSASEVERGFERRYAAAFQ